MLLFHNPSHFITLTLTLILMSHLDIIVKKKRERGFTEERKRNIQKLFSMSRRKGEREKKRYQLKQVFIKGMEEVIWNDWLNDCYLIWYDWPNSKTGYTQLRYCAYNEVLWNTENVLFLMSQRTRKQEREREREREICFLYMEVMLSHEF